MFVVGDLRPDSEDRGPTLAWLILPDRTQWPGLGLSLRHRDVPARTMSQMGRPGGCLSELSGGRPGLRVRHDHQPPAGVPGSVTPVTTAVTGPAGPQARPRLYSRSVLADRPGRRHGYQLSLGRRCRQ
jgi:hypothetical protein